MRQIGGTKFVKGTSIMRQFWKKSLTAATIILLAYHVQKNKAAIFSWYGNLTGMLVDAPSWLLKGIAKS